MDHQAGHEGFESGGADSLFPGRKQLTHSGLGWLSTKMFRQSDLLFSEISPNPCDDSGSYRAAWFSRREQGRFVESMSMTGGQ